MEERLGELEEEEEHILLEGGRLTGSMVGRRRIALIWAVGEAWARFSTERAEVVRRAFRIVGLSLPIDGSEDHEISIKGLASDHLAEHLKDWGIGERDGLGEEVTDGQLSNHQGSTASEEEEINFCYE